MQFTLSAASLLDKLQPLSKVIAPNPVLPILDNIHFELEGKKLTLLGTDLQVAVKNSLSLTHAEGEGKVAVPAAILRDMLKSLPEQPLKFEINMESYQMTVTAASSSYKLACESPLDFPALPEVSDGVVVNIPSQTLREAIGQTLFAASKDPLSPSLKGVHLLLNKDSATFVATDGHHLARYIRSDIKASKECAVTIPTKALSLLLQLLVGREDPVQLIIGAGKMYCAIAEVEIFIRLLQEQFPDYNNVIPQQSPYNTTITTKNFLDALKRVAIFANKSTNQVKLSLEAAELSLVAEDHDFANKAFEKLPCLHQGKPIDIGFNVKLLTDIFKVVSFSEEAVMHIDTPGKAVLILPKEQPKSADLLLLIMPVLLKEEQVHA
jgi:DNA polymerase-3 subunit beta